MKIHVDKKGSWQTGQVGVPLQPLQVCIQDDEGIPVHKLEVKFRLVQGKGWFSHRDTETDAAGCAVAEFVPEAAGLYRVDCLVGGRGGRQTQFTGSAVEVAPVAAAPAEKEPSSTEEAHPAETPVAADTAEPTPAEQPVEATEAVQTDQDGVPSGTLSPVQEPPAEAVQTEEPSIIVDPSLLAEESAGDTGMSATVGPPALLESELLVAPPVTEEEQTPPETPTADTGLQAGPEAAATDTMSEPVQTEAVTTEAESGLATASSSSTDGFTAAADDVPSLQELADKARADTADQPPADEPVFQQPKASGKAGRLAKIGLVLLALSVVAILLIALLHPLKTTKLSAPAAIPGSVDCSGVTPKAVGQTYVFEGCRKVP